MDIRSRRKNLDKTQARSTNTICDNNLSFVLVRTDYVHDGMTPFYHYLQAEMSEMRTFHDYLQAEMSEMRTFHDYLQAKKSEMRPFHDYLQAGISEMRTFHDS